MHFVVGTMLSSALLPSTRLDFHLIRAWHRSWDNDLQMRTAVNEHGRFTSAEDLDCIEHVLQSWMQALQHKLSEASGMFPDAASLAIQSQKEFTLPALVCTVRLHATSTTLVSKHAWGMAHFCCFGQL